MRGLFAGVRVEACLAFRSILMTHGYDVDVVTFEGSRIEQARERLAGAGHLMVLPMGKTDALAALEEWIRNTRPDIVWSAGFPYIVPSSTLALGPLFVNSHPHLLPEHKGANPIRDTAAAGVERFGVTTHRMTPEVDEGEILVRREAFLNPDDLDTIFQTVFGYMEPAAVAETLTLLVDRGMLKAARNESKGKR